MPLNRHSSPGAQTARVTRGKLIRLRPSLAAGSTATDNLELTFQYNPETLTFTRTGRYEPRKRGRNPNSVPSAQQTFGRHGGHGASALLSESETISFTLMFDATETVLRAPPSSPATGNDDANAPPAQAGTEPDPALGVLPELSFLQLVSVGREVEARQGSSSHGTTIRPIKPDEVLLQLGGSRWYPCAMTELRITEQRHNLSMVPIRAECAITLNVLEPVENSYNDLTRAAFEHLMSNRVQNASVVGNASTDSLTSALTPPENPQ